MHPRKRRAPTREAPIYSSHRRKPVSSSLNFLALHSLRSDSGLCTSFGRLRRNDESEACHGCTKATAPGTVLPVLRSPAYAALFGSNRRVKSCRRRSAGRASVRCPWRRGRLATARRCATTKTPDARRWRALRRCCANIPETASTAARRIKWRSRGGMPGKPRRMAVCRRPYCRAPYSLASKVSCRLSAAKPAFFAAKIPVGSMPAANSVQRPTRSSSTPPGHPFLLPTGLFRIHAPGCRRPCWRCRAGYRFAGPPESR